MQNCSTCSGSGEGYFSGTRCPDCNGSGVIDWSKKQHDALMEEYRLDEYLDSRD